MIDGTSVLSGPSPWITNWIRKKKVKETLLRLAVDKLLWKFKQWEKIIIKWWKDRLEEALASH